MMARSATPDSARDAASFERSAEEKIAFHLRLRARGIRDHAVLRAFEIVPRALFMPARYAVHAGRDVPLPLPFGQTSHEPWRSALAIEALGVEPTHRVLEIGSGSGFETAILAQLAGEVLGIERWVGLAEPAHARLHALGLVHAAVAWGDGLALSSDLGLYDRILIHAMLPSLDLFDFLLAPAGQMVAGHEGRSVLRTTGGIRDLGICTYAALVDGLAGQASA